MLEFRVLGSFEVRRDGAVIDLGGARRRAFLALLVLNAGRVLRTEQLVDALWGESAPRTALHVLHVYASALRKLLESDAVVARGAGYVLEIPPEAVDLVRFERLVAAARSAIEQNDQRNAVAHLDEGARLWRGPMLEDLAYEEFVQPEARRLEELRLAALELRAEAILAVGADASLVGSLAALAEQHPLRERLQALHMRALAATGRQADALAVYEATRRRLDDELGIEPGADLRAAQLAVLRQEVQAPPRSAASAPVGTVLAAAFSPEELADVSALADAAAGGNARELIIGCVLDRASVDRASLPGASRAAGAVKAATASPSRAAAFLSADPGHDLAVLAAEHDVDLVVVAATGDVAPSGRVAPRIVAVLEEATADVALLVGRPPKAGAVLAVPFGGSDHDWAALELAALVTRSRGGSILLIALATDEGDASRIVARAALSLQRAVAVDAVPVIADPGVEGLLAAAAGADALVLGISDRWRSEGLGPLRATLAAATGSAIVLRRGLRPGLFAPPDARTRFNWSIVG